MKNFRQLVNELPSRKIVFTFGRFQPPTVGHELLVKAVQRVAKSQKADHVIYTSRSQDKKKNPLDVNRKVYYLKRMFPQANIVGAGETTRTFIEVAKELNKRYKQIVMVAGSDRVTEYNRILNEYNGKEFNFETIQVVSAGERDPDADDASGMSGTKMRELAKKGDFSTFKKGLPSTLTTTDARRLMNDIRVGLGMEELKEEVKFETDLLREMYHKGDIFLVGQIVESKGQNFEIVDRGANYLSVVDRNGNISKKWLNDVKLVKTIKEDYTEQHIGNTNQVTYKGYTTKNFDHDRGAVDAFLHTIAKNKDPVATLNAIKATDNWLGIVKKALATDTYTKQDSRDFYSNLTKAQDALNNMDEFLHHLDYFNNHVHDMERIAAQYHTDTDEQGQESYIPTGELLEMKFMSGDKIKVARIIATTLGVPDVEKISSPTQLVNAGLRLIRNKPMRPEYLEVIKKMLQTAKDAGIDYEETLLPSKAKEVKESFKQFLTKEAVDELPTADTKLDKRGRKIPAHKIVFNPNEVEYQKKDVKEGYNDNRRGFGKRPREDDEYHVPDPEIKKNKLKEQAPSAPSVGIHRIAVTVSEPDHPMVSKRKETTQKFVRVPTSSKERAVEQGKKHFQKKGYKVHDAHHVSMVYEEAEQIDEISQKLAGDYYGAATKKHVDKVGVKPNMYGRIEKDMGAKRKAGVDRAMDRIMGNRKTNEAVEPPKDASAPKMVRDRKTGQMYDPQKKFSDLMKQPKIQAVFKRLAKEEVEQIDELSKDTLNSYRAQATGQAIAHHHSATNSTSPEKIQQHSVKTQKRMVGASKAYQKTLAKEEIELDEAIESGNKGNGYHGQHDSEVADKKYSATHAKVKKIAGEAGHLRDAKKPNVMVKHYLDSKHGRHLAGNEGDHEYIKKDFGRFKKAYKPELHESSDLNEDAYAKSEENKRSADAAKKQGDMFAHHLHMADHHENLSQWHSSKGRHGEADKHAEKSEEHHEKAMSLKEEKQVYDPESEKPKLGHESKPEGTIGHVNVAKETSDVKQPHTQAGSSFTGDESLRRRKAYHKMHEEVTEKILDGMEDDEAFTDDIEKITEPEHIMHLYDDEEFFEDDEDGETEDAKDDDEDEKEEVNEAIGRMERVRRGIRFKRTEAKRERLKAIALKRMSSSSVINKRARRHAVIMMKQRLARKPLDKLSTQEKERLETFIQKRKALIARLATRIAPKIRKIEKDRLQKRKSK